MGLDILQVQYFGSLTFCGLGYRKSGAKSRDNQDKSFEKKKKDLLGFFQKTNQLF